MLQQKVQSRSLEGFRGIILILAVIASVLIGSVFFSLLERSLGTEASTTNTTGVPVCLASA